MARRRPGSGTVFTLFLLSVSAHVILVVIPTILSDFQPVADIDWWISHARISIAAFFLTDFQSER
jgi:hypothetical protein